MTQRTAKKANNLSEEKIQKLDELGFVWSVNVTKSWDDILAELTEYKAENGDCMVQRYSGRSLSTLGTWVATQQTAKKKKKISKERIQKLDELKFEWGKDSKTA